MDSGALCEFNHHIWLEGNLALEIGISIYDDSETVTINASRVFDRKVLHLMTSPELIDMIKTFFEDNGLPSETYKPHTVAFGHPVMGVQQMVLLRLQATYVTSDISVLEMAIRDWVKEPKQASQLTDLTGVTIVE